MSPREKKLLLGILAIGFLLLNFWGYGKVVDYRNTIQRNRDKAKQTLQTGNMYAKMHDEVDGQIKWLNEHEPEPAVEGQVIGALQQFVETQARSTGLTLRPQKVLTTNTTGPTYHRAKVEFNVTGDEESLYKWIGKIQIPTEFRAVTSLKLAANKDDDSKIDATVTVEQWFIPVPQNT